MTDHGPHRVISPERLYWSVLDPKPLGRTAIARTECGYLFEDALPLPIESVHASYRWLPDGRVVACGIERAVLEAMDRAGALTLVPASVPEPVLEAIGTNAVASCDARDLNLLTGPFEPAPVRAARRRLLLTAAAIAVAFAAVTGWGVVRRGDALDRATERVEERRVEILTAAYAGDRTESALPPEYRLVGELRQLTSTRSSTLPPIFDAGPGVAAMVAAWPQEIDARCDAIGVSERTASIRGTAKDSAVMSRLEEAYRGISGWSMPASPQFSSGSSGLSFTITLTRVETPPATGGRP
jgi:hypothetical protein